MLSALLRWVVLTLAVFLAAFIIPGISYDSWKSLLIASLVLGLLNTFLKPIITLLSLPFIVLTLGLFLLIVNAITLSLTGWLVDGFQVSGFWPALFGSLVISLVNLFFGGTKPKVQVRHSAQVKVNPGPASKSRFPSKNEDVIDI
ncbi:MAG: phage holin family protein [Blastochloris sp.]|nr:phage holin family protein [Blastochloris sp.]